MNLNLLRQVSSNMPVVSRKAESSKLKAKKVKPSKQKRVRGSALRLSSQRRKRKCALAHSGFRAALSLRLLGTVENKVANGCVTRGNLPNSSGQILKKAKKRCLMSLRSIR
ncbi:hypothetical protein CKAN_02734700 [Cinnamomum micranthum f. kanehirae]|uniref:Uncharacterized protein n=1 Tax=Cinnamomum micranthum f. kanehirae TaxID=337451 RepID=A0A3S3PBX3_9MAGN|nr:hypothetical protein CKAN_02734700 [Cinnamomum micranthum f. kanehirae]